jgi:hypothetical protein
MLPEHYCQLLSAYLDGELSPQRRKAVVRLLRKSRQARALFRKLEKDSRRLRALPPSPAPPDLTVPVMNAITERGLRPLPATPPAAATVAASGFPTWAGFAIAASLLIAVATASYLFFSRSHNADDNLAQQWPPAGATTNKSPALPDEPGVKVVLRQLGARAERTRLAKELQKDTSFRLSVVCRDSVGALQRLQQALGSRGIGLVVERSARDHLSRREGRAGYLLYTENLHPEELAVILRHLGGKAKGTEPACEMVFLSALTSDQRGDLAHKLGVSVDKLPAPRRAARPTDVPLPPLTDTIIVAPARETAKAQPTAPKDPPAPQRLALVLACDAGPTANPGPEIRDFLRRRREQRPGTLQVVFVLHERPA